MHFILFSVMFPNYLLGLTSISQWALFIGIALIIFGLIEKREMFVLAGQFVFLLLGFLAMYILLTDEITVPQTEVCQIAKELKVLVYYKSVALFMGIVVISLLMKLFNLRFQKVSIYILIIFALLLFFMVFNIQQMAN